MVQEIREHLGWAGRRMTRQRRIIFTNLAARKDHPDVDTLYEVVKGSIPKLSVQTVYRTIALFEDLGLVKRVAVHKGRIRYDAKMEPHSHFMCESCGAVSDVDFPEMPWVGSACRAGRLGAVHSCEVLLKGICHDCLADQSSAKKIGLAAAV